MMTLTTKQLLLTLLLVVGLGRSSAAQGLPWEDRAFFNLNIAFQTGSSEFRDIVTFPLYLEEARFEGPHRIEGGGVFDISGGIRVWRNVAVGVGFSSLGDSDDVVLEGLVPHPQFTDTLRATTAQVGGLNNRQRATHLQAIWMMPLDDKLDVAFFLGPSFINVKQDVVTQVTVNEVGPPFDRVALGTVTIGEREKTAVGFNIGADLTYMVRRVIGRQVGVGMFLRYAGGSVDLPLPGGGSANIDVGGFQLGGGLRVRF